MNMPMMGCPDGCKCEGCKAERLEMAAPDLLAELKSLTRAYVRLLEIGRDRIVSLGGTCDPVDRMEEGDPDLRSAKAAIAKAEI